MFGDDENTHVMGWKSSQNATEKDLLLKAPEEDEDNDWEQEFNKFYVSPLDSIDELKYLEEVFKQKGHIYGDYMSPDQRQKLVLYLSNAPQKN